MLAGAAVAPVSTRGDTRPVSDKVLYASPPAASAPVEQEYTAHNQASQIRALAVAAAMSDTPAAGSVTHLPTYTSLPPLQTDRLLAPRGTSRRHSIGTDDSSPTRPFLRPASLFSLPNPHSPITPDVSRLSLPLPARVERELPSVPHSPTSSESHSNLATSTVISSAITREMIAGGSSAVTSDADHPLRQELAVHQKHLEAVHRVMRSTGDGIVSPADTHARVSDADVEADPPPEYREEADDAGRAGADAQPLVS